LLSVRPVARALPRPGRLAAVAGSQ